MLFDPNNPHPFGEALKQALPNGWGISCESPDPDSHYEECRRRDLAREAREWASLLQPGETTDFGERILLSLGDVEVRYSVVLGQLTSRDGDVSLFIYSLAGLEDTPGEFHRLPRGSSPLEVARKICRLSRPSDQRMIEAQLREAQDGRHITRWFPGERVVIFDLETTGLDTDTDRIVEASWLLADHRALAWDSVLVNPGVPIPEGAYTVHGIDDALASSEGTNPRNAIDTLTDALAQHISDGATLVAFNHAYDLPLLNAECQRHNLPTLADRLGQPVKVIDPLLIWQRIDPKGGKKDSHKLELLAALCSSGGLAAHSSLSDCLATWDVLAHLCRQKTAQVVYTLARFRTSVQPGQSLTLDHLIAYSDLG